MKNVALLIPARYGSTRFEGKPLINLGGKTMVQRVFDVCKSTGYDAYVLTDDMRIFELFGSTRCWIEEVKYDNGTERCAGAIKNSFFKKYDHFVNVQGDMPDVTIDMIEKCISSLDHYPISTVFTSMPKQEQNNPNSVKMVRAGDNALWFGRGMTGYGDWHMGVYGYRRNALEMYLALDIPEEECVEKLEQLRWLKSGWKVGCLKVDFDGTEINTPEDYEKWKEVNK